MKIVVREMLKIYQPISRLDWLNYRLIKGDVTYHHIQKRTDGGRRTIENGALLMPVAHQYLHLIECRDDETYKKLNEIFKVINEQRCEPSESQRKVIEYLLREFEDIHRYDKGSKGKLLLQKKYLAREFKI